MSAKIYNFESRKTSPCCWENFVGVIKVKDNGMYECDEHEGAYYLVSGNRVSGVIFMPPASIALGGISRTMHNYGEDQQHQATD